MRRLPLLVLLTALAGASGCRPFSSPPAAVKSTLAAVQLTAENAILAPEGTTLLAAIGGEPPYSIAFANGGDRSGGTVFNADAGSVALYQAGPLGGVTDTLHVTDGAGQTSLLLNIAIGTALQLSPPVASVAVGGAIDFAAVGGQPPFGFGLSSTPTCDGRRVARADAGSGACLGGAGTSCILASAEYTSGAASASGTDWVFARDRNGVCALSPVEVGAALEFASEGQAAAPGQSLVLAPFGGSPPYQLAFDPHGYLSGGLLTAAGVYTAGPNANLVDHLWATDAAGNRAPVSVSVGDPLLALPANGVFILRRGDFNGDKISDLAAISLNPSLVAIEVVLGGPRIGAPIEAALPSSTFICDAEVGDINGDGIDDIALNVSFGASCSDVYPGSIITCLGLASEVMGDGATPTPPQALVDNLRLPVSKSPTAIGWYLLGRALTLSTSAGADYHTLVLGKLPGPRFDRPLTDDDARLLGEAHHALGLAREQLGSGGEPMPVRAGISLAWVMELEAVAPGGDPASAVSALQLYLSCAEAAFDSQGADSPEFIEAMASGQHAYDALPFWRRWAQFDARSRMTGLNSKSAAARQKSVDDIAALKQRHEELCRRTPLVISLDGSLDPLEFSDDQAVVSFALDPFARGQHWSWVGPHVGLLVWDPHRRGLIASGAQLFGSDTWLMAPPDGFTALSMLDANLDGWIDGAELRGLRLWIDADGDGRSSPDEVFDLEALGIRGLATDPSASLGRHFANPKGVRLASGSTLPLIDWIAVEAEDPVQLPALSQRGTVQVFPSSISPL